MKDISIQTANVDSPDWLELFVKSVRLMTKAATYEIVVIDQNSLAENLTWIQQQHDVRLIRLPENFGHGGAMDLGARLARARYVCFLDVDAHVQRVGWETDLVALYQGDPLIRLIGCVGPEHKPLHPPLFFYEPRFVVENGISFRHIPGLSTDTAQKAYWDICNLGYRVHRLEKMKKVYDTIGDEIDINGQPSIYHHWYGTRFQEHNPQRLKQELDGYSLEAHLLEKRRLFDEPLVKAILNA